MTKTAVAKLCHLQDGLINEIRSQILLHKISSYKVDEKKLINELGKGFLKVIPRLILLSINGVEVQKPKEFRPWCRYSNSYILCVGYIEDTNVTKRTIVSNKECSCGRGLGDNQE